MPSGDLEALGREIRSRYEVMGKDGGYLMAPAHIIQADVSAETVKEMIKIIKEL